MLQSSLIEVGSSKQGSPTPERLLERFGLESFRSGQREAVQAALEGRDSLVVMPTGGGKSLCYQLPALAGEALVVVVSPLIALMADQLGRLQQAGVNAAMLASGMADGHNARALRSISSGEARLVLAAPERFASRAFRETLATREVGLFVVDEAHCVAEWGHDFRPDYLRLHDAIEALGRPAVMATTATATPRVAEEIAARLGLHDWLAVRSGFDRPNLTFDVVALEGKGAVARKRATLLHALERDDARPAIVYCGTRKHTDEVASLLREHGIDAVCYHAGMSPDARRSSQEAFMGGRAEVVVATNAFGMGVDKADVRTVVHWAVPTSLEAYYQEAGRGGRDGRPGRALLLASRMDLGRLIRFINERETTVEDVKRYVGNLHMRAVDGIAAIGHGELGGAGERERVLLSIAERAGAVELQPGGPEGLLVRLTGEGSPRKAYAAIKAAKDRGWEAYRSIERFISSAETCRRRQILDHFGDREGCAAEVRCCDVCEPDAALVEASLATVGRRGRQARIAGGTGRARDRGNGASGRGVANGHDAVEEVELDPVDERAFEALKAWRLGRSEGKPAYTVAANAALEGALRAKPATLEELIEVKGIGPTFCERHGESLLQVLADL
ncbi:MAG TPA: RecQ family ATP-dependent DNA helicase [Solirubrobacteraceae bacterium]|jgi:ATP-dependent DNA helicase RecQ|nr:RecQ family ATP-dependent DNA helicase [Solirubrobacteraceae bacterium]